MKKPFNEYLESFREKDLKLYSRLVNKYFRRKWRFVFVFLITSCSVQNEINKDDLKIIPKKFSVSFYDKPDTIRYQYDNSFRIRSLIKDFSDLNTIEYSKPIHLEIKKNQLFLKFEDRNKKQYVLKFYGKQHKKKFVFYTNYETVSFPIVFMRKQMTKYTISLLENNEIVFQNTNVSEGMLLLFGAGSSSEFDYKFKLIKNE